MSVNAPVSPSARAAFLKSSSLTRRPIWSPLAAITSASLNRLVPLILTEARILVGSCTCVEGPLWAESATRGKAMRYERRKTKSAPNFVSDENWTDEKIKKELHL